MSMVADESPPPPYGKMDSVDDQHSCATSGLGESLGSGDSSAQASQEMLQQHQSPVGGAPCGSSSAASPTSPLREEKPGSPGAISIGSSASNANKSWLLRLFESKLFDASMAMAYMFNSKEPGVLGYIGNKLFTYAEAELDFYLPQMVNMYVMYPEVAEVLHPYLIHRYDRFSCLT